ncbi:MAG: GH74 [uncultured Thermomicrobiales bacterium]|uniref:GH74 n=1 Tax=uncultured Thermomicrobiales bacterium TaxID=1645740 RepID=A0A6J4TZU2_9BACT|nr:MAG: GH74 [uncultured Thermomicrobiales bacterium]
MTHAPTRPDAAGRRTPPPRAIAAVLVAFAATLLGAVPTHGRDAATPSATVATPSASPTLTIGGDRIVRLVSDPSATGPLAVIGGRGLYRSGDGGATWHTAGPVPPAPEVVAAGDDAERLMAGGDAVCADEPTAEPLWGSTDGGATWDEIGGSAGIAPLATWAGAGVALGVACDGLRFSADAGLTWTAGDALGGEVVVTSVAVPDAARPAAVLALTGGRGSGVLRAVDLTDPAAPVLRPPARTFWGTGQIAALGPCRLLGLATGVAVSGDQSVTWTSSRVGIETATVSVDPNLAPIPAAELERGFGITAVAFGDDCARQFLGTGRGLFASADGGATWDPVAGADASVRALAVGTDRVLVETGDGVVVLPIAT